MDMNTAMKAFEWTEHVICFSNQLTVPKEDAPPPPLPCTCTVTIVAQENEETGSSGECHSCSAHLFKR